MIPLHDDIGRVAPLKVLTILVTIIVILIAWAGYRSPVRADKACEFSIDHGLPSGSNTDEATSTGFRDRFVVFENAFRVPGSESEGDGENSGGLTYLETPRSVLIYQNRTKDSWPDVTGEGRDL